jgi:hypothetical protein
MEALRVEQAKGHGHICTTNSRREGGYNETALSIVFTLICCRLVIVVVQVDYSGTGVTLALKWRRGTNVLVHGMLTPAGN